MISASSQSGLSSSNALFKECVPPFSACRLQYVNSLWSISNDTFYHCFRCPDLFADIYIIHFSDLHGYHDIIRMSPSSQISNGVLIYKFHVIFAMCGGEGMSMDQAWVKVPRRACLWLRFNCAVPTRIVYISVRYPSFQYRTHRKSCEKYIYANAIWILLYKVFFDWTTRTVSVVPGDSTSDTGPLFPSTIFQLDFFMSNAHPLESILLYSPDYNGTKDELPTDVYNCRMWTGKMFHLWPVHMISWSDQLLQKRNYLFVYGCFFFYPKQSLSRSIRKTICLKRIL